MNRTEVILHCAEPLFVGEGAAGAGHAAEENRGDLVVAYFEGGRAARVVVW